MNDNQDKVIATFTIDVLMTREELQKLQEDSTQARFFLLPNSNNDVTKHDIEFLDITANKLE